MYTGGSTQTDTHTQYIDNSGLGIVQRSMSPLSVLAYRNCVQSFKLTWRTGQEKKT